MRSKNAVFLILIVTTATASPVTVSILSLLSPKTAHIALKTPGVLTVIPLEGDEPVSRELARGTELGLELSKGALLVDRMPGRAQAVRLACDGGCLSEIRVPGMSRLYHGDLDFHTADNTIQIVLLLDGDELAASVVESESGGVSHAPSFLQAFAVVVRSFVAAGRRHRATDFCDTTHCQVFQGRVAGKEVRAATTAISGLRLCYQGRPFRPYYSRSCGGKTATYEEVWDEPSPDYPFFTVSCPCIRNTGNAWTSRLAFRQLAQVTGMPGARLQRNGNRIMVSSTAKTRTYSVENFRTLLGRTNGWTILRSNRFDALEDRGAWKFAGRGAGHGVGFCQEGAEILAREGADFRRILQTYFPETTIEIR